MKRLLTFLMLLTVFIGVGWAAEVTITASEAAQGVSNLSYTNGDITLSVSSGAFNATDIRVYKGATFTVSSSSGNITNIEMTMSGTGYVNASVNSGSYSTSGKVGTWTGNSSTVVFTAPSGGSGNQLRIEEITITYSGGTSEPDPTTPSGTITFTPAAGEVTSGTTVAMSFSGTCTGIKYTTDGTSPSATNGTVYDSSNPPAITGATTITAAAYNYSNSKYAFGTEATASYTVIIPTVEYDGTATFNATVDAGTSPLIKQPVTFACSNGVLNNGSEYRLYKSSTTTFSVPTGYKIVKIEFTGVSGNPVSGFGTTTGLTINGNDGTWIGEEESVSFTASGAQVRCTLINVYYTAPAGATYYYLVGSFNKDGNDWVQGDANYMFTENNGVYELNDVDLPDNTEFKIIKVENGTTTWYGGATDEDVYRIHGGWHENITLTQEAKNFKIEAGAITDFSFTVDNDNNPSVLNVNRDAQMFVKGDFSEWDKVAMTGSSTDGWTLTQEMSANDNFGFIDEWGQWRGCPSNQSDYTINSSDLGTNLGLWTDGKNFIMALAGTYSLQVTGDKATLTVTSTSSSGDLFELVTDASTLNAGDYVIITNSGTAGDAVAMGADRGNNRGTADVTISSDIKITPGADVQILTLEGDASCWYFNTGNDTYLRADGGSSSNHLKTGVMSDNAKASITSGSGNTAEIVFQISGNRKYLRYNPNNNPPIFSCYESGKQSAVYLFRKPGSALAKPTIEPATGNIKGGLVNVTITAAEGAAIYYTTDGSTPTTSSELLYSAPFDVTGTGGQSKTVKAIAVLDGNVSDVASATYTFQAPSNPVITPDGGTYDGRQHVTISSTDGGIIYYLVDPETTPANAADVITAGQVYTPGTTAITLEAGIHKVYAAVDLNGITSWAQESYTINADPLALSFSPAAGTYVNAQSVTITANNAIGDYTIYYTTDGTEATASSTVYSGPITVDQDMTINAYAVDSRDQSLNGKEATASATYNIGVQPVEYSPIPGTIYKGDNDNITVEMFSVTPNAKIYYTMTDDGTEPADPTTGSTLYSAPVPLETGKTYKFKAIAVAGSLVSTVTPGTFTVQAKGTGWLNVDEMAKSSEGTSKTLDNPVQVVYMSTWRNGQDNSYNGPEFCFVRDNSGYGLIYFGNGNIDDYKDYAKFQMGDWIEGGKIAGDMANWSSSFINELGGSANSGYRVTSWPTETLGNTDILPEETTNLAITQGWTYEGEFTGTNYSEYIDADKNLFGHYVHMRKNTIDNVSGSGNGTQKHIGIITDQSGVPLNYYDGLYLFSGYNNTPDYNQEFFNNIQNNGGTFDIYAIVYFYGPNAKEKEYSYAPYEIFPIDFLYIYKPMFNIQEGTYMEPQTVTLTCATEGAQIWYKTSEMEDYALYTGPITVDATTTIDAYSTIPTKYNDVMESVINSITINIGSIEAPVITEPSVVKTVGESVTTSITCTTGGATIYYTTDGSDPKTSETRQIYSSDLTFEQTTTVRAIAYKEVEGTGYYSAEAEAKTYTFVKSNGIIYNLVTSNTQLNENSVYVIVNKDNNMAVGTTQNENNRAADGVKFVDEATKAQVFGNDDLAQFTLKKVGNNWYLQTANSTQNGYLYVGNGNTLMTEATADGNAEATINIDGNSDAHISFMYNYETVRYLRYWLGGKAFSTYTSEASNLPVSLYYIQATPLATIEKEGVPNGQYTIADQLLAVYADVAKGMLWCKDQGNVSIAKTEKQEGQIDFMKEITKEQTTDWDQSNWVVLQFDEPTLGSELETLLTNAPGKYIKPATISGTYSDVNNYTITMADQTLQLEDDGENYVKNLYCTANFLPKNLNINGGQGAAGIYHGEDAFYFFMNPKVQEVCEITYAEWDGENIFIAPLPSATNPIQNDSQIDGAFTVDWTYNVTDQAPDLTPGAAYRFLAVVQRTANSGYLKSVDRQPSSDFIVYPLNLNGGEGNIVTGINKIDVDGSREVKSVKYVNVAGMVSDKPFSGVNIVVTEYTDGSRTTSKMLRK